MRPPEREAFVVPEGVRDGDGHYRADEPVARTTVPRMSRAAARRRALHLRRVLRADRARVRPGLLRQRDPARRDRAWSAVALAVCAAFAGRRARVALPRR